MNTISIYIHIPFCIKKCPYCSFNSVEGGEIPEDAYIEALLKELSFHIQEMPELSDRVLETIYFGGGTPSLISAEGIERVIGGISLSQAKPIPTLTLPLKGSELRFIGEGQGEGEPGEVTLEVNPGTVTLDKLKLFKEAGINRLSIGVQSFDERRLKFLGRIHTVRDALKCYEDARSVGFHNVGIDLISCIPGQTISEWCSELDTAVSLRPEHISAYTLSLEKGTPFYTLQNTGKLLLPSEEDQAGMFEFTIDRLTSAGYLHYEVSNYALQDYESRHNNRYWRYRDSSDYIGLGAGAHSYMSFPDWGVRRWNESPPDKYMKAIEKSGSAVKGMERLSKDNAVTEAIFLGLRKTEGIDLYLFSKRFSLSLMDSHSEKISELIQEGFLTLSDSRLSLTRKGLLVADSVIIALLS
ncbi:MAG: radical SAM family heme chaperone HemW [Nitrospirae bacterium]|nr:radical SAM family heme chaperone HemW [Nitrospirota bacterium]